MRDTRTPGLRSLACALGGTVVFSWNTAVFTGPTSLRSWQPMTRMREPLVS